MKTIKLLFCLATLLAATTVIGQSTVTVQVTEVGTSNVLEGASVTLNSTTIITNSSGNAIFPNLANGLYPYTVDLDCYEQSTGFASVLGSDITVFSPLTAISSAPVFVGTSDHPLIGSWVDGNINLSGGGNNYNYDVTEFDNLILDVAFGTYDYTFSQAGGCFPDVTGTLVVDCDAIDSQSGNVPLFIIDEGSAATSAPVFIGTSDHPLIGSWVDGNINLSGGGNNYNYDVTEFDNLILDVAFGTYDYTFSQAGGCFPDVTGTLVVDCDAIDSQSGNVPLFIIDEGSAATSAPVFIGTSDHPLIGSWVDGNINLSGGGNNYNYDVTEFDNLILDVAFGTYDYTFSQAGGCFPDVTGTLVVDCDAIDSQSGNVPLFIIDEGSAATSAPVFIGTSDHPLIGSWVDGNINLSGGGNNYNYDVTEFDNLILDVAFGTYDYTFSQAGGCFPDVTGTLVVDCDAIDSQSGNVPLFIIDEGSAATSAPVFIGTSDHPLIGSWVDGNINLSGGGNNYNYDVTEFDNLILDVAFGTYDYTFSQAGGCFPDVTGTLVVDCDAIDSQSGNVPLFIIDEGSAATSAPVFIGTSDHPLIGSWVDGNINLSGGGNNYNYDVTEFDNLILDVAFGTYDYTFSQAGGCFPDVTGTLVVDCDAIDSQSGNVPLFIIDEGSAATSAPVFIGTSDHPLIGSWVDGNINLSGGGNNYNYDVTEFDNLILDVAFGTYDYTFSQAGGCFPDVTGTLVVDCDAIDSQSGNVPLFIIDEGSAATSAPVFIGTSDHPLIGSWVDGNINLSGGGNNYNYDVTEFDNLILDVAFGTYDYTFSQAGGCFPDVTGTLVVDCDAIDSQSGNVPLFIIDEGSAATSAPVFIGTSDHPLIGSWVDGNINLSGGGNNYNYDVTEFDNLILDVAFGTYDYTFSQAGGCFPDVTGTLVVDCDAIDSQSGNVPLFIIDEGSAATSAPVFVLTSDHPLIGSWVDGNVTLTGDGGTFEYDVTEFDNLILDVPFGTYNYTFAQAGGCYPEITGSVTIDCDAIDSQSGNVLLIILDEGTPVDFLTGDINMDGQVDIDDFLQLNSAFGSDCEDCPEDINGDGTVNTEDFLDLNSNYGSSCQ